MSSVGFKVANFLKDDENTELDSKNETLGIKLVHLFHKLTV